MERRTLLSVLQSGHLAGAARVDRLPAPSWAGAAVAVAVAAALAFYHLASRSLWGDEAFSIALASKSLGDFWHVVSTTQANMSLYYVLLRGWLELGDREAVVRLLSVLAALLVVPILYLTAARLFDRRVATLAALLLAVNGFFLHYAQEARAYALVLLLTATATALFLVLEEGAHARVLDGAYVLVATLAIYAHFFAAFVLAGHLLALIVAGRRLRFQLTRIAATAVLSTPLFLFAIFRDTGQISHLRRPTPTDVVDALRELAGGKRLLLLLYALSIGFAAFAWFRKRSWRSDWGFVVAASWAATPIVGALLFSLGKPVFEPRYLSVALPGLVILAAAGLAALPSRVTILGLALVLGLSTLHVVRTQGKQQEDFRAATSYVLANARPGDAIAFYRTSRRIPFEYYVRRHRPRRLPRSLVPASPYGRFDLVDDYRHTWLSAAELRAIGEAAARGRLWLFLSEAENERVPAKRQNRARLIAAVEGKSALRRRRLFAGLDIRLYAPSDPDADDGPP